MTFAKREISLLFSNAQGVVTLRGLRVYALIEQYLDAAHLELRVWGMSIDQMNQFSSTGENMIALQGVSVTLVAGDHGKPNSQSFTGNVITSHIDFSTAPEVCFVCSAVTALVDKATPAAPNSFKGANNAEDMIKNLAAVAGYAFNNNGAHAVIVDQYVSGSLVQQMTTIARAASFPIRFNGISSNASGIEGTGSVSIWANDGSIDSVVIDLGPDTGMVGYPSYWLAGLIVKSEFNPNITVGRQIKVSSVIPKANRTWPIHTVTHEISTLMPDGPWFTTARLSSAVFVSRN